MPLLTGRSPKSASRFKLIAAASISSFSTQPQHLTNHSNLRVNLQNEDDNFNADIHPSVTNHSYWTKRIHGLCTVDRDVDSALILLNRICLHGYHLNALNVSSIIHGLCDANRYSQAHHQLLLYVTSQPNLLDERTCNVLISRLLYAGTPDSTLYVIRCLINANPNFVPSLINYHRLIHQFCHLLKLTEAHEVFLDMKRGGHVLNAISYTVLINGYCKVGKMDIANSLFDEMCECGLRPNPLTYSVLMRGTFRNRDVGKGKLLMAKLWEVMECEEEMHVNSAAFSNLINCLCEEGLFHEVFKIAEDMPQGKGVSEEFAYAQMIDSLSRFGRYNGAARIVYMMRKRGFTPGLVSYNSIVHGLCQEGDFFRAFQLLEEGISFNYVPSEFTFKPLAEGLCQENDLAKANAVLNLMLTTKEGDDKTRIYNIYLRALSFMNNPTELLNVLVSMLQTECKPDIFTLNTVLSGFCRMRRIPEASKVLKDMMTGLFCAPNVMTFSILISGLLDVGKVEEALDLFQNVMPENGFNPDVVTYGVVLRGLVNLGHIDRAMEIFNNMVTNRVGADSVTYSIIIKGLFESGKVDEAKRFWDDVIWPSGIHNCYVYSAILKGLCCSGKFNEACDFLYELVDCGVTLHNVNYNIVINGACKLGLKKEAYQILGEMRKNGLTPDSITWRILNKLHDNVGKQYDDELSFDPEKPHELKG